MRQLTEYEYKQGMKDWVDRLFKYIYPANHEKELSKNEKEFRELWRKYIDSALLLYHVKLGVCPDSMMGALFVMRDTAIKLRDDDMWCYKPIADKYCNIVEDRIKKEQNTYRQNKYGIITYYTILGVSEKASMEEIKSAYLNRIDDVNKGISKYKFDDIHAAFNKLSSSRILYNIDLEKKRKNLHYDAVEDVEIVSHKKQEESSVYKRQSIREAREDEKYKGDNYIMIFCFICVAVIVIGLLVHITEGSIIGEIQNIATLIYMGLFGVFSYHCSCISKNFNGSSILIRNIYNFLGGIGYLVYIATLVWSLWMYDWWMPLLAGLCSIVVGGITSLLFQRNMIGMILSMILVLVFACLSFIGLIGFYK